MDSKDFEFSYWLGFYFADGCIGDDGAIMLELSEVDRDHVVKAAHYFGLEEERVRTRPARTTNGYQCQPMVKLRFKNVAIRKLFADYGLGPRKARTAKLLDSEGRIDRVSFWRGVWDGDGCVSYKNRKQEGIRSVLSGCKEMLEDFAEWVGEEFGVAAPKVLATAHLNSQHMQHSVWLATDLTLKMLTTFYGVKGVPCLERKRQKTLEIVEKELARQRPRGRFKEEFQKLRDCIACWVP